MCFMRAMTLHHQKAPNLRHRFSLYTMHDHSWWSRPELNRGPENYLTTFIHVCSWIEATNGFLGTRRVTQDLGNLLCP